MQTHAPSGGEAAYLRRVLIVDDDDDARAAMAETLRRSGFACTLARSGEEALEKVRLAGDAIAVIVLDVHLAGISGYDVLRRLDAVRGGAPILLVSGALNTEDDVVRGLALGAVDFVAKPAAPAVLAAKVERAFVRYVRERELSDALESALEQATVDELTRVYNRRAFEVRLAETCASASRCGEPLSLLLFDVDHFKAINDHYGHLVGDEALVRVACVLRGAVRDTDLVFRYGGEEFACVLPGCDAASASAAWDRVRGELTTAPMIATDGSRVEIRVSAGLAVASVDTGYARRDLLAAADGALYAAKRGGRDRLQLAV